MMTAPDPRTREVKNMSRSSILALPSLIVLAILCGCETGPSGRMSPIPPPAGWEEAVEDWRQRKNDQFRRDPETPLLAEDVETFEGLDYWAPDPDYYFVGQVNLYMQPEQFEVVTTSGQVRPCAKVGWVSFEVDGQPLKLQVYRLLDQAQQSGGAAFFVPFMDGTTGQETYPAGRYLDLQGPEGGPFILDFNMAYNPWCAYGAVDRYVCPVTPPENRLSVRVEAGERGYRQPAPPVGDEEEDGAPSPA
jgi:uncharacterized protein (DUF1684 family)